MVFGAKKKKFGGPPETPGKYSICGLTFFYIPKKIKIDAPYWPWDKCFETVLAMRKLLWTSLGYATIALNQSWPCDNCFGTDLAMRQLLWTSLGHATIALN